MSKKDVVTLGISALAFVTALATFIQRRYENRSARRLQLTETMSTLLTILAEIDSLRSDSDELLPPWARRSVKRLISKRITQLYSVALQADFLIRNLPAELISEIEYSSLANSFWPADDPYRARFYFEKSIEAAEKSDTKKGDEWYFDLRKARYIKDYANFLFSQREDQKGRCQYDKAAALLSEERDQVLVERAWTYSMRARSEARVSQVEAAEQHYAQALKAVYSISDEQLKQRVYGALKREFKVYFPFDSLPPVPNGKQPQV